MTYVTDFGVIEQPGRFNVDMYIHAATVTGAYHAADRRLKDWGIDWHLDNVEKGQDSDFDNNCPEYTQANFMRMELVDFGLYYLVLGVEKSELSERDKARLSAKARQDAKKHGWEPYIDHDAAERINIVPCDDEINFPECVTLPQLLICQDVYRPPETTAPLTGELYVKGCCTQWVYLDGFRVKDNSVLLLRKGEVIGKFWAPNVHMTMNVFKKFFCPEWMAAEGAKI